MLIMTLQRDKGHDTLGGGQELMRVKEQSAKAEAKSGDCLTFFTAIGMSSNHFLDQGPAKFL